MSTTQAPPEEAVDTEDVELTDDEYSHAACSICYPIGSLKHLDTFIAICGRKAVVRLSEGHYDPPPNACPDCKRIWRCPRCGL